MSISSNSVSTTSSDSTRNTGRRQRPLLFLDLPASLSLARSFYLLHPYRTRPSFRTLFGHTLMRTRTLALVPGASRSAGRDGSPAKKARPRESGTCLGGAFASPKTKKKESKEKATKCPFFFFHAPSSQLSFKVIGCIWFSFRTACVVIRSL